ncbi:MAG TPA: hypothetical protein VMD98_12730, partial [Bryocella sp.]|nr:hypothetical protein [Bryocella sp.]
TPFYGGFGLIAAGNLPKPSFYAMELLHRLGDQRIANTNPNVLVTKNKAGMLTVAVWNLANPGSSTPASATAALAGGPGPTTPASAKAAPAGGPGSTGAPKMVKLEFKGVAPNARVAIRRVDADHGDTLALWQKMGSPHYPTERQLEELREQSRPAGPDSAELVHGVLTLDLPVNGLAVLELQSLNDSP